jgi:hypothetical protein
MHSKNLLKNQKKYYINKKGFFYVKGRVKYLGGRGELKEAWWRGGGAVLIT